MMKHFLLLSAFLCILLLQNSAQVTASNHSVLCSLPAPSHLSLVGSGTSCSSSWSTVSGAANYQLDVLDLTTSQSVYRGVEASTSKSVGGLTSGHTYRFTVAAMCSDASTSDYIISDELIII